MTDEELSEIQCEAHLEASIALAVDSMAEGLPILSPELVAAIKAGICAGIYGTLKALGERQLI